MTRRAMTIVAATVLCLAGCGGGGGGNRPPLVTGPASQASDQATTTIDLQASDPEGGALTYAWSRTSGPGPVRFSAPTIRNPEVTCR